MANYLTVVVPRRQEKRLLHWLAPSGFPDAEHVCIPIHGTGLRLHHIGRNAPADLVADPGLYVDLPLLWLGTDAFLPERSRRIGKTMPSTDLFLHLLEDFEQRKIRHYHYWISSDQESDWPEFISEVSFIQDLRKRYPRFGLLAHAPFLVPYPDTPLWYLLERNPEMFSRVRFTGAVRRNGVTWNRAIRIEPRDPELARLLDNQPDQGEIRFFEALKENDNFAIFNRIYNGLRESRMRCNDLGRIDLLLQQEKKTADILSRLMPPSGTLL